MTKVGETILGKVVHLESTSNKPKNDNRNPKKSTLAVSVKLSISLCKQFRQKLIDSNFGKNLDYSNLGKCNFGIAISVTTSLAISVI